MYKFLSTLLFGKARGNAECLSCVLAGKRNWVQYCVHLQTSAHTKIAAAQGKERKEDVES